MSPLRERGFWGISEPLAAILEEGAEQCGGTLFEQAAFDAEGMIEAGVGWRIVEGAGVPGFGIRCRVDKAGETACVGGPGAHGAWFQGGVEGAACQSPASYGGGCTPDGEEFGVGGRIPCSLTLVACYGQDLLSPSDYGPDRNLAHLGGILSSEQGTAHHANIGLRVILCRWRHKADDSSLSFADVATDEAGSGSLAVFH